MGVLTNSICVYYTQFEMHVLIEFIFSPHTFQNNHRLSFKHHKHLNITTEAEYEILINRILFTVDYCVLKGHVIKITVHVLSCQYKP